MHQRFGTFRRGRLPAGWEIFADDFCRNANFGKMYPIVGDIGITNDGHAVSRIVPQRLSSFPLFMESRRKNFMEIPHGSAYARDDDKENHCRDYSVL